MTETERSFGKKHEEFVSFRKDNPYHPVWPDRNGYIQAPKRDLLRAAKFLKPKP